MLCEWAIKSKVITIVNKKYNRQNLTQLTVIEARPAQSLRSWRPKRSVRLVNFQSVLWILCRLVGSSLPGKVAKKQGKVCYKTNRKKNRRQANGPLSTRDCDQHNNYILVNIFRQQLPRHPSQVSLPPHLPLWKKLVVRVRDTFNVSRGYYLFVLPLSCLVVHDEESAA